MMLLTRSREKNQLRVCGIFICLCVALSTWALVASAAAPTRPTEVKIGTVLSFDNAFDTLYTSAGMRAAFEECNENDCLLGTNLSLVVAQGSTIFGDNAGYTATTSLDTVDNVLAVLGPDYFNTPYAAGYTIPNNIPVIAPSTISEDLFAPGQTTIANYKMSFTSELYQMINFAMHSALHCTNFLVTHYADPAITVLAQDAMNTILAKGKHCRGPVAFGPMVYNFTELYDVMFSDLSDVPSCILILDAASGMNETLHALHSHPSFNHNDTHFIAPSASNAPSFSDKDGTAYTFENLYLSQVVPDPLDTTRQSVRSFHTAFSAFTARDPVQPNVTGQFFNFTADPTYPGLLGYMYGRMMISILQSTPDLTRAGVLDTMFRARMFAVDEVPLGPLSKSCSSPESSLPCWCNTATRVGYMSRVNLTTMRPQGVSDNPAVGEKEVAYLESSLEQCGFSNTSFGPAINVVSLIPMLDQLPSAQLVKNVENFLNGLRLGFVMINLNVDMANNERFRSIVLQELTLQETMAPEQTFAHEKFQNISRRYLPSVYVLTAADDPTDRTPRLFTRELYMAVDEAPLVPFSQWNPAKLDVNPTISDLLFATASYIHHQNFGGEIVTMCVDAKFCALSTLSLHSYGYRDPQSIVTTKDDTSTVIALVVGAGSAAPVGISKFLIIATQDDVLIRDVVTILATLSQTRYFSTAVIFVTDEEFLATAITGLPAQLPPRMTCLFASGFRSWWDGRNQAAVILSQFLAVPAGDIDPSLIRGFVASAMLYELVNKAGQGSQGAHLAAADLLNALYGSVTLSILDMSFGPFYRRECDSSTITSNNRYRTCQCAKGPRKFYLHSLNDWINKANTSSTDDYLWAMSTCGVVYTPLEPITELNTALIIGASTAAGVAVLALAGAAIRILTLPKRDNSAAPKDPIAPFAMVFTDIQSSTALWARAPEAMSEAVEKHHSLMRKCLKKHKGYEVKTIGDSFMVAFQRPDNALAFAVDVQQIFFEATWSEEIDEVYRELIAEAKEAAAEAADEGWGRQNTTDTDLGIGWNQRQTSEIAGRADTPEKTVAVPVTDLGEEDLPTYKTKWNGVRVRIGIHYGLGNINLDPVSLGYDYYGTVVNTAARVEGVGHGGQVLATEAARNSLSDTGASNYSVTDLGPQPLRGLDNPVRLYQFVPQVLAVRSFPALRLDIENEVEDDASSNHSGQSIGSMMDLPYEKLLERMVRAQPCKHPSHMNAIIAEAITSYEFLQTLLSTSPHSYRNDAIRDIAKKWHVPHHKVKKGSVSANVTEKTNMAGLVVKVTKAQEAKRKLQGHLNPWEVLSQRGEDKTPLGTPSQRSGVPGRDRRASYKSYNTASTSREDTASPLLPGRVMVEPSDGAAPTRGGPQLPDFGDAREHDSSDANDGKDPIRGSNSTADPPSGVKVLNDTS